MELDNLLLHHLQRGTQNGTTKVAVGVEDASTEAVVPADKVSTAGDYLHFVLVVGNNFTQLLLNIIRVLGLIANTGQRGSGLVELALLDKVTRRFGQEKQSTTENKRPEHLDGNWNTIRAGIVSLLSGIVDARSQHETNGDAELIPRNNGTTDLAGGNLGHVQNNNGGDETNTEASNQTASNEKTQARRSGLQNNTDDEDGTARNDGNATAKPVSKITGDDSTKEGSRGEDGGNQRFLPGRNDKIVLGGSFVVLLRTENSQSRVLLCFLPLHCETAMELRIILTRCSNVSIKYLMPKTPLM